jgi:hypothetical protein
LLLGLKKNPQQFPAGAVVHTSTFTRSGIEVAMHAEANYPVILVVELVHCGRVGWISLGTDD